MTVPGGPRWLDEQAGPLVRAYAITNGRAKPTHDLDLLSQMVATGQPSPVPLDPEQAQALLLCQLPASAADTTGSSVAEIAGRMGLPVPVVKIVLGDLMDIGTVAAHPPGPMADPADPHILKELLHGLRQL